MFQALDEKGASQGAGGVLTVGQKWRHMPFRDYLDSHLKESGSQVPELGRILGEPCQPRPERWSPGLERLEEEEIKGEQNTGTVA